MILLFFPASITDLDDLGDGGDLSEEIDSLSDGIISLLNDMMSRCQEKWYPLQRDIINDDIRVSITIFLSFDKFSNKSSKLRWHPPLQLC